MDNGLKIIAEVKPISPSFRSEHSWEYLFELANRVGDIISIHTDVRWGGSFDLLKRAREMSDKPILAKGIHQNDGDISRAIDCGANYVLVVGRLPGVHNRHCIIEPYDLNELKQIPLQYKVVWNSRDIRKLGQIDTEKTETFEQAREIRSGWLCQASNIRTIQDIKPGANAVLVGSYLPEFAESLKYSSS